MSDSGPISASPEILRTRLDALLASAEQCTIALMATLTDERQALAQRDLAAISNAADAKRSLVETLQKLEYQRAELCAEAGLSGDPADMPAMLDWCDAETGLAPRWQRILDTCAACDQSNRTNGAAIQVRRQQVAEGLTVLRGHTPNIDTYGPGGSAAATGSGRPLTEA